MGDKRVSIILEVLAAMFLILSFYPIMRYGSLAGIPIPQHYSKDGCVDIWTTRAAFIYLGLIFIAVYAFLSFCQSHPKFVNVPFSGKMPEQDRASLGTAIAGWIKLWCTALFAYLSISTYRIALGKTGYLNNTIMCIIALCAIIHLALILFFRKD